MQRHRIGTLVGAFLVASCLAATQGFTQLASGTISTDTLASRAMQQYFNTRYTAGSGRSISSSSLTTWLQQNRIDPAKLPSDVSMAIRSGSIEALIIPNVSNPLDPSKTGEVAFVRTKCSPTITGCIDRGVAIPPPAFTRTGSSDDELCENCTGCSGPTGPNCTYDTCVCTMGRCPRTPCKTCPPCAPDDAECASLRR